MLLSELTGWRHFVLATELVVYFLQKTERKSPRLDKRGMKRRSLCRREKGNARMACDSLDPGCKTCYTWNRCSSLR